jgi:hypothetical protein
MKKCHYDVLGVDKKATADEIKKVNFKYNKKYIYILNYKNILRPIENFPFNTILIKINLKMLLKFFNL